MVKLLHCADVHLKAAEKDYGLAVLREIVGHAAREGASFLLICGDLFDSFPDAAALRREVAAVFNEYSGEIIYLPGNHEERNKAGNLSAFDLGKITLADTSKPFNFWQRRHGEAVVEFAAISYQRDLSRWRDWQIPFSADAVRIALAHATIPTLCYIGDKEEGEECLLDEEFFHRHHVRYAALGHIHKANSQKSGETLLCYPGSATVWREGEQGPRQAMVVEIDAATATHRAIEIKSAGQYRSLAMDAASAEEIDFAAWARDCGEADLIEFAPFLILESDNARKRIEEKFEAYAKTRLRQPRWNSANVRIIAGLAQHPLAEIFLPRWRECQPEAADQASSLRLKQRAKELALSAIGDILAKRRQNKP